MDYQEEQKELDRIIEKVKQGGYAGLTEEEKHTFFHSKLGNTGLTRFYSKIDFWLTMVLLLVLVIHGIQRLVLAKEMGNTLKLNSVITNNRVNTTLNIIFGLVLVVVASYAFISYLLGFRKNRIIFFYRKDDGRMRRKYYWYLVVLIVLLVLFLLKTIAYGTVFFKKMGW